MGDAAIQEFNIFKTVLYHSVSLLLLPIASFFFSKLVLFDVIFKTDTHIGSVWSAIFAVVILHILLGLFIHRAYFGISIPEQQSSKDRKMD